MSYLDNLTQGLSNTYSQVYRKPRYTQIGNTSLQMPRTISLDQMYAAPRIETAPPQLQTPTYTPPIPETQQPITGYQGTETALEQTGKWHKYRDRWGNETWMPTAKENGDPLKTGDIYEQQSGVKWVWNSQLNTWLQLKRVVDPDSDAVYWTYSDIQPYTASDKIEELGLKDVPVEYEDIGAVPEVPEVGMGDPEFWDTVKYFTENPGQWDVGWSFMVSRYLEYGTTTGSLYQYRGELANLFKSLSDPNAGDTLGKINQLRQLADKVRGGAETTQEKSEADTLDWMADNLEWKIYVRDFMNQHPGITSEEEWAEAHDTRPTKGYQPGYRTLGRITAWQTQLSDLMGDIQQGNYIKDDGTIDYDALRNSDNIMGQWFADTLEQSYGTGLIMGDIMDESGNLAPELQVMEQYFQSPEQEQAYNKFSRELAFNALAKGQTLNSGYYSNYVGDIVANRAAEITDQVASLLSNEIESQYKYVANSIKNMLIEAGRDAEAERLTNEMNTNFTAIQQEYQQQIDLLAQAIAEQDAAQTGDIFTGVLAAILSIVTAII